MNKNDDIRMNAEQRRLDRMMKKAGAMVTMLGYHVRSCERMLEEYKEFIREMRAEAGHDVEPPYGYPLERSETRVLPLRSSNATSSTIEQLRAYVREQKRGTNPRYNRSSWDSSSDEEEEEDEEKEVVAETDGETICDPIEEEEDENNDDIVAVV